MSASWDMFEKLRASRGLSAYQIAKDCDISQSVLSNWKAGRYTPKEDKIKKLATYLDVPVSYFYGGDDEEPPKYYLNDETAAIAQKVFDEPGLRALFDAASGCTPRQLDLAAQILRGFKETNPDG